MGTSEVRDEVVPRRSTKVHDEVIPRRPTRMEEKTAALPTNAVAALPTEAEAIAFMPMDYKNSHGVAARVAQVFLRAIAALCMLAAVILLLFFAEQTYYIGDYSFTASYRSSQALEYFVLGCGIAGLYSILSISFVSCSPRSKILHGLDMMVMALAISAFSAAAAVGYIGMYGNETIGWAKVCNYAEGFCSRSLISLALAFSGFAVLFFISALSYP